MSRRLCFALDLIEDAALIAEYEAIHVPGAVPADVIADINATGFLEMEIWRTGNRCFMIATVTEDFPRPRDAEVTAGVDSWESAMWRYQQPLPHAAPREKWVEMTRIFSLDEQQVSDA